MELDYKTAVDKMLSILKLRIKTDKLHCRMPGVSEDSYVVRRFVDGSGGVLEWYNDNPMRFGDPSSGNGILRGSWTVFKNTDMATFSLFTEKMQHFTMLCTSSNGTVKEDRKRSNPFFGSKSIEEVLVKCDLMERCR